MKIAIIGSTMIDVVSYVDKSPEYGSTVTAKGFQLLAAERVLIKPLRREGSALMF